MIKALTETRRIRLVQMWSKHGNLVCNSLMEDLHKIAVGLNRSKEGMGIEILKMTLPRTAESVVLYREQLKQFLEQNFPILPEEGTYYVANILSAEKREEEIIVICEVNSIRPPVQFQLTVDGGNFEEDDFVVKYTSSGWEKG